MYMLFCTSEQLMSREFETFRRAGAIIGWRRPAISAETSPSWRGGVTLGGTWCQRTLWTLVAHRVHTAIVHRWQGHPDRWRAMSSRTDIRPVWSSRKPLTMYGSNWLRAGSERTAPNRLGKLSSFRAVREYINSQRTEARCRHTRFWVPLFERVYVYLSVYFRCTICVVYILFHYIFLTCFHSVLVAVKARVST